MRLWQFVDLQHIHTWRSSHVTALKRPALRGTPVSDVYFTFSSTKTRGGDIKEENERDTKESSCTWIIKKKRKHKLTGGEMGEEFNISDRIIPLGPPPIGAERNMWGQPLRSPHIWAEWEQTAWPSFASRLQNLWPK